MIPWYACFRIPDWIGLLSSLSFSRRSYYYVVPVEGVEHAYVSHSMARRKEDETILWQRGEAAARGDMACDVLNLRHKTYPTSAFLGEKPLNAFLREDSARSQLAFLDTGRHGPWILEISAWGHPAIQMLRLSLLQAGLVRCHGDNGIHLAQAFIFVSEHAIRLDRKYSLSRATPCGLGPSGD